MMRIGKIPGSTRELGAPSGWDSAKHGECGSLPVRDHQLPGGVPAMDSDWYPSPDQIKMIAAGAPVRLTVVGAAHPPVAVGVGEVPGGE